MLTGYGISNISSTPKVNEGGNIVHILHIVEQEDNYNDHSTYNKACFKSQTCALYKQFFFHFPSTKHDTD